MPVGPPVSVQPPVPTIPELDLAATGFDTLNGWAGSDPAKGLEAFRRSCGAIQAQAADALLGLSAYAGSVADWGEVCRQAAALQATASEDARAFFETVFVPYRISQGTGDGFFTGYYEPELKGSRTRHGAYQTPLYGLPPDLVTVDATIFRDTFRGMGSTGMTMATMARRYVPYPARTEIERDGLPASPLFYVDDPIGAFFLQIQGSGRVMLDDGTTVRAAYAGQNGRPYTAIGAVLLERGELTREELSLQSIRAWLIAHPGEAREVMDSNDSYVFFSEQPVGNPLEGPLGTEGVALTARASLAVDASIHALGVPVWLEASAPDPDAAKPDRAFNALLVMQDTGSAIRGAVRGDVYWGFGAEAESVAGRMKHAGRMTVLLPRSVAARLGPHAKFPAPGP